MEVAQLSARIDVQDKRRGDATLARFGASATQAIRALWRYLAEVQRLPDFMSQDETVSEAATNTVATVPPSLAAEGAGMALSMARERGLVSASEVEAVSYDELRDLAFEELVTEGVYHV